MKFLDLTKESDLDIEDYIAKNQGTNYEEKEADVGTILKEVKQYGDKALYSFTEKFDGPCLKELRVSSGEIEEAYGQVDQSYLELIAVASSRIKKYHEKQLCTSWMTTEEGSMMGQLINPLERVGVYVPGGKAFYPSSVLMNVIPAKVAGVESIVMTTPPDQNGVINPYVLVAANEMGVKDIYKIGGAQAVGALAYGTETILKVDKIIGPGNIYVALAKKEVYGYVDIDSIAGPSEILVVADESANPIFVAADLLSQAEHDEMASVTLVSDSKRILDEVKEELKEQLEVLERKEIASTSLHNYGTMILVKDLDHGIEIANKFAPEHLELSVKEPLALMTKVKHAGAIFLGHYTPEPLGDYMAGPNHVLPTNRTARFASPLGVNDFIKRSSVLSFSKEGLSKLSNQIIQFAELEQLGAHANAIRKRFE